MSKNKRTKGMSEMSVHYKRNRSLSRSPAARKYGDTSDSEGDYEYNKTVKYSRKRESSSNGWDKYYKENDYRRKLYSTSRWEKKTDEYKSKNRDKSYKDDNNDNKVCSRSSPLRGLIGASGSEIIGYKSHPPNNTIMIRGLAEHITESEVQQDIIQCGLMAKDIRLIRKKLTGASRGFAFVEFGTLGEAVRWMDMKQGVLVLQDGCRAILQYSISKAIFNADETSSYKGCADWFCIKCGAQNFKRRDLCYKCHASRTESEEGGSGCDEICNYVTKTLLLRNLDALTTEDSVLQAITTVLTEEITKKISTVCIGRDSLTSISRGICYLGTESTIDALTLYTSLVGVSPPLTIDGKAVIISYCKYNMGETKRTPEHGFNAAGSKSSTYALSDVDRLAEHAAIYYSKGVSDFEQNYKFYKDHYTQQILAGNSITLHMEKPMQSTNAAAAVAHSAIRQVHANKMQYETSYITVPTGTDGKYYSTPDPSKFVYDENSGFHYDSSTGLFYDSKSTYYWNSSTQKYLYFDPGESTYLPAPVSSDYSNSQQLEAAVKAQKIDKYNKVPVARKIIKDMEKWAKSLNQKKTDLMPHSNVEVNVDTCTTGSADIGYTVLEENNTLISAATPSNAIFGTDSPLPNLASSTHITAAYGEVELSDNEDEKHASDEFDFLNFIDFVCTLCKRQLNSADLLIKHAQSSNLHKKNLETFKSCHKEKQVEAPSAEKIVYRDRAKERRMKYGYSDEPMPSILKERYLKSRELREASVMVTPAESISSENVGSRLLQKMGWTEGQGLGKSNQGRTTIIQAEQRNNTSGLGNKATYAAQAGESYRDCVKKTMYARYRELS